MHHLRLLLVLSTLGAIAVACVQTPAAAPEPLPVAVIDRGQRLVEMPGAPGARWVTDQSQLSGLLGRRGSVPSEPVALPEVDFTTDGVLAVWMGEQPTGGYSLELAADQAVIEDGVARVTVKWLEPAEGMVTPQVITNPYLMIRLPRGGYDSIAVVDEHGVVRVQSGAGGVR